MVEVISKSTFQSGGLLGEANTLMRAGSYAAAIQGYLDALSCSALPRSFLEFNLELARARMRRIEPVVPYMTEGGFYAGVSQILDEVAISSELATILRNGITSPPAVASEDILVSVVMPTWNRGAIIGEAIRSVLKQSYRNWELLVCDDASDDDTATVVAAFSDSRIRYLRLKKGNGAIARNHGLRVASGDVIAFLDSDNVWSPARLQHVMQHHRAGAHIVYTGFVDAVMENDRFVSAEFKFRDFNYAALAHRNYIDLNTLSFCASIFDSLGGFDPSLPRQQDWDLLIRYTAYYKPIGVNLPLVLYRRNKAWDQVTETKKHIDTRSIVMTKNSALVESVRSSEIQLPRAPSRQLAPRLRTIAIKISAPNEGVAAEWGDYHFAHQLGVALWGHGWSYVVHCNDRWYSEDADVNLVLRGRFRFEPKKSSAQINLLWVISHPDRLGVGELDDYDHVFIASDIFGRKAMKVTQRPVSVLHQATDPAVFCPPSKPINLTSDVIFVGNSRNEYRELVRWSVEKGLSIGLWGTRWEQFVPPELIAGQHILNAELASYYGSANILLNDHWLTMRNNGFLSNRLFDGSAAGAFILTDAVAGLAQIFGDAIDTVSNAEELYQKVKYYREHEDERRAKAARAREIVLKSHTFAARAAEIDARIGQLAAGASLQRDGRKSMSNGTQIVERAKEGRII